MRRYVAALFVRFENSPLISLTDGWVFQGVFHDRHALARAVRAVEQDIKRNAKEMQTITYKVVELNE